MIRSDVAPLWPQARVQMLARCQGLVSTLRRSCSPTARQRGAVERENGRLKNEWALSPLRVRRIERVRLHAVLTILARLATALAKARAVPLATEGTS